MRVICNTGPLIALAKVQRLDLLSSVFSEVLIPQEVSREFSVGLVLSGNPSLDSFPGFRIVDLLASPDPLLRAELDDGEAAVIQMATANAGTEVLLDERKARRIAAAVYNLRVLGTGGLLLRAKLKGALVAVKPVLDEIRSNGYFMSDRSVV
jgi:uncharacterized protein